MPLSKVSTFIVILNYNSFEETINCIASIKKQEKMASYKIILIDNASREFNERKVNELFPDVITIKSKTNLGFAGGVNIGIRMAIDDDIDYTLLLNNDTIVTENFLSELIITAKNNAAYGIISPQILYHDNPDIIWYRGGSFNSNIGLVRHLNLNKPKSGFDDKTFETEFISGCCMLIKKDVLKKVGALDEDYFLYNEDLDFCYKAKNNGFKLLVNPKIEILHVVSASTNRGRNTKCDLRLDKIKAFYITRNDFLFIKKNLGFPQKIVSFLGVLFVKCPYVMLKDLIVKRKFGELKEFLRGIWAGIIS